VLIDFIREGLNHVENKKALLERLARLYEMSGDEEQAEYYRRLAEDHGPPEGKQ
jgi:hypothetical protein